MRLFPRLYAVAFLLLATFVAASFGQDQPLSPDEAAAPSPSATARQQTPDSQPGVAQPAGPSTNNAPDASVATPIATAPVSTSKSASVVLVLDTSKSARGNIDTLRKGALSFAQQFDSGDELALFFAADKPTLVQDFTGDTALIANSLKRIRAKGDVTLFDTLAQAVDRARSDAANDQSAVVAFANDLDSASSAAAANLENSIRQKPGVPVYLIALRQSSWKSQEAAQRIAVLSGGAAFFPQKSSEVTSIAKTLAVRIGGEPSPDADFGAARSLATYRTLLVRSIPVANNGATGELPGGDNLILQRVLLSRLQKAKLFPEVRELPENADTPAPSPAAAPQSTELELLPMIVGYRHSDSRHRRGMSPFYGGSRLRVQVVLRDRATQAPIAAFTEEASGSRGWLSGNDEKNQAQAMMSVSNKIVSRLRDLQREADREQKRKKK